MERREKGFTLLEVLLTIILIAVGFTALLQAFSIGLFSGAENENELIAMTLAQEKMEDLRNRTYVSIVSEARAAVTGYPSFERQVVVTTPQTGLALITTTVFWASKGSDLSVVLVTYISNT